MLIKISAYRRPALRSIGACTQACALAFAIILAGCSADEKPPVKSKVSDHAHDHDSQPGHSHDDGHDHSHDHDDEQEHGEDCDHDHDEPAPGIIPIPAQVRDNLGITFATVQSRRVASTLRVPGRFEPLPSAVQVYHAPLGGKIELLVHEYDTVTTGTPLYRLDSAEWRRMQQELLALQAEVMSSSASLMTATIAREGGRLAEDVIVQRIEAAEDHISSLRASITIAEEREHQVLRLQNIMGGRLADVNEARSQLASLRNELSQAREDRAELEQQQLQLSTESGSAFSTTETLRASYAARQEEYYSSRARLDLLRGSLLAILDESSTAPLPGAMADRWEPQSLITVYAAQQGVVSSLPVHNGTYVDAAAPVLTVTDPSVVRFRGVALQSDIHRLQQTMNGELLAPVAGAANHHRPLPVQVSMAIESNPTDRTIDLVATVPAAAPWVRIGVSTNLDLLLDGPTMAETVIPIEAVIQDGLDHIVFRRDPDNPDRAIRVKAEFGLSDGNWIVLKSGVETGDEVVLDGIYELKLATADSPKSTGHFHADGTFHDEDH